MTAPSDSLANHLARGGKGAALVRLAERLAVPPFSILDTSVFRQFLCEGNLLKTFADICRLTLEQAVDEATLDRFADVVQLAVARLPMSASVHGQLSLIHRSVHARRRVARSSGDMEDGATASWAGQFVSVFGADSSALWETAVRRCWGSLVTASIRGYRPARVVDGSIPAMAVVLQEAVDARAAGVVFSQAPQDPGPMVEATWGLGGPLVAGDVTPERWVRSGRGRIKRAQRCRTDHVWMLDDDYDRVPGSSIFLLTAERRRLELRKDSMEVPGVWSGVPLLGDGEEFGVLDPAEAEEIMAIASRHATQAGYSVDLEWAIERDGRLWWLQSRHDTTPRASLAASRSVSVRAHPGSNAPLARGIPATVGSASGPGWWHGDARPNSCGSRPILFKETTDPRDVRMLLGIAGLATRDGGVLSHSAIVTRELGIPCLVGVEPFPPNLVVTGRPLVLDADSGEIREGGALEDTDAERSPAPPLLRLRRKPVLVPTAEYLMGEKLLARLPARCVRIVRRIASIFGVIDAVRVLPDFRLREPGIGFPVGVSIRSIRFHPTAVCDWGDGFRVATIEGISADEMVTHAQSLVGALHDTLGAQSRFREQAMSEIDIREVFSSGIQALDHTFLRESDIAAMEEGGWFPGGSISGLPQELRIVARESLVRLDRSGHFLEILLQGESDAERASEKRVPVLFLHTGSIEAGEGFLNYSIELGRHAALREGIDDIDSIRTGFWGLDTTRGLGSQFLANALGLTNYGFVRRLVLHRAFEVAASSVFRRPVRARLLSDVVHSAVRVDGDGLLHQQGVQISRSNRPCLPMLLSGAPRVNSFLFDPLDADGETTYFPHGKVYVGCDPDLVRDTYAHRIARSVVIDGELEEDDYPVALADAQVRESAMYLTRSRRARIRATLFPVLCMRGRVGAVRKLRV